MTATPLAHLLGKRAHYMLSDGTRIDSEILAAWEQLGSWWFRLRDEDGAQIELAWPKCLVLFTPDGIEMHGPRAAEQRDTATAAASSAPTCSTWISRAYDDSWIDLAMAESDEEPVALASALRRNFPRDQIEGIIEVAIVERLVAQPELPSVVAVKQSAAQAAQQIITLLFEEPKHGVPK